MNCYAKTPDTNRIGYDRTFGITMQVLHRKYQACERLSEINSLVISDVIIEKNFLRVQYFFAQRCCAVFRVQSSECS